MKNVKFFAIAMIALTIISCGSATKNGTLLGGGGGAALGALVGNLIGKNATGTAIGAVVGAAVGGTAGNLIGKHMDKVKAEAAANLQNAQVTEATDANGLACVKVTFDNGILFKVGKADLQSSAQSELAKFAQVLKNNTDCAVAVQGYASSEGSAATNQTLSQNRANSVTKYLTSACGVTGSQITSTTGYGATNLITKADGTEDREASRRVEVYLYASQAMIDAANAGTLK